MRSLGGAIVVIGVVLVLVDEAMNAVARLFGGSGIGLLLAASVAAVVLAYVIRFLAIEIGFAQAACSSSSTA